VNWYIDIRSLVATCQNMQLSVKIAKEMKKENIVGPKKKRNHTNYLLEVK